MTKKIKLLSNYGSLDDREPFLCDINDRLILEFESGYSLDGAIIQLENGETEKIQYRQNFEVPQQFLKAGVLKVWVVLTRNGQKLKEWVVEPILLKELGNAVEGFPLVEEIQARIMHLTSEAEERDKELAAFKTAVLGQIKTLIENHNKLIEQVEILQSEQAL